MKKITIGARGSKLSLAYATKVKKLILEKNPHLEESKISIKTIKTSDKENSGLGLGIFIGKTLLEKNYGSILCRNSKTRNGAEVIIKWKNIDLMKI